MKRMWMNYLLDVLLFLTAMALGISSLLVWVVLPKGYNPQWLLWIAIHKWSGFALFVETFLHIVLHWKWIVATTRKVFRRK
jgi:predicted small integral membrane protein